LPGGKLLEFWRRMTEGFETSWELPKSQGKGGQTARLFGEAKPLEIELWSKKTKT